MLRHFQEIEERRLWTGAGSLYKYIALTFGLTSDQIYPRLQAMRLMRAVPEMEQKLEVGELSVTNALKAQQAFTAEEKGRDVSMEEKREVLESLSNASTKEAEKYPETRKLPEKVKPVAENRNLIQYYVDDETLKAIEELKAKYSHQMPSGQIEDLMKILIQCEKRQPKRWTRHLGCNYMHEGQRCGSKHFVQLDHIHEYSRGGLNEVHNLHWMCGFHNRHRFVTRSGAANDACP